MRDNLDRLKSLFIVAVVILTISVIVVGKQEGAGIPHLFIALMVVSGFVLFISGFRVLLENEKAKKEVQMRKFNYAGGGVVLHILTSAMAIWYGSVVALCIPLLLVSVAFFAGRLARRIRRYR